MKKLMLTCVVLLWFLAAEAQIIKGTFAIKNVKTGMLLRVKDASNKNGTPLVAYNPMEWKCMTWDFKHLEGNTYQLQNLLTQKTVQPVSENAAENVSLEEQPFFAGKKLQSYEFISAGKNQYRIKLKNTDLYITPENVEGEVNSAIILARKRNTPEQLWTLYEQHPSI